MGVSIKKLEMEERFSFMFIEEWTQFLGGCNWYTFHPFHLRFEDDRSLGSFEVSFVILGLGFDFTWNHTNTEKRQMLNERYQEIKTALDEGKDLNEVLNDGRKKRSETDA